jgi:hypothetical protein
MQDAEDTETIGKGKVPQYRGPENEVPPASEYWEREDEIARFFQAREEWLRERERMRRLREQLNNSGNNCEGPIDTGGGFEPPGSEADIDKSKVAGGLVTDPAVNQGGQEGGSVLGTKHPGQVTDHGYEGGDYPLDAGMKAGSEQITDPAEPEAGKDTAETTR